MTSLVAMTSLEETLNSPEKFQSELVTTSAGIVINVAGICDI